MLNKYTILIEDLLQDGVTCKNPTIRTETNTCLAIACDNEAGTIVVTVPEDCEDPCFDIWIKCEDCDICPEHEILNICICDEIDECEVCRECVDGLCIPKDCPKLCLNGDCVDCIDDTNCPCDQTCTDGECGCPPGFLINASGCCVECLTANDCEGCDLCIAGGCTPKTCTGELNPLTCDCVECLIDGDCVGDNRCCIDNSCRCCPGFYQNAEGECVEIPDCVTNTDCPACFVCEEGDCVPLVCPDGRVCVDGNCEVACDCNNPNCPQGKVCVESPLGECYCKGCEGPCDDDIDCGEGCICVNGVCTADPCFGACSSGEDCPGTGCGCYGNECTPCSELSCDECALASGCDCINGTCQESNCDNPCDSADDCDSNCGCQDNTCVACSSVSCVSNAQCPEGCYCNGGTCTPNPCAQITCGSPEDCGPGCTCIGGFCVPCSSLSCTSNQCADTPGCECNGNSCVDSNEDCLDNLTLSKVDSECDLTAELTLNGGCCQCDDIEARVALTYSAGSPSDTDNYIFSITLRKGGVLLNSTGITGDAPISGQFRVTITDTFRQVNALGNFIPGGLTQQVNTIGNSTSVAGLDTIPITVSNLPGETTTVVISGNNYKISQRVVKVKTSTKLSFINECEYELLEKTFTTQTGTIAPASTASVNYNLKKLVQCRVPLFEFFTHTSTTGLTAPARSIEKVYATRISANVFRHTITSPPDLIYNNYYAVQTACGCDNTEFYSCYGDEGAPTPLIFCDPTELDISVSCDTLTFNSAVTLSCDVYLTGTPKPTYELYINGVLKDTITFVSNPLIAALETYDNEGVAIQTVTLKIQGDEACEDCTLEYNFTDDAVDVEILEITSTCSSEENANITFVITGSDGPFDYTITRNGVSVGTPGTNVAAGQYTVQVPNATGTYVITVTDDGGCVGTATLPFTVNNLNLDVNIAGGCNGVTGYITIQNLTDDPLSVTVFGLGSYSAPANQTTTITPVPTGTYSVSAFIVGQPQCSTGAGVIVNCCADTPLDAVSVGYTCSQGVVISNNIGGDPIIQRSDNFLEVGLGLNNGLPPLNDDEHGAHYIFTFNNGGCDVIRTLDVYQCYTCPGSLPCVAADGNAGPNAASLAQCTSNCGTGCDTCSTQEFFISGRISTLTVGGIAYPWTYSSYAECSEGGSLTVSGNLAFDVAAFLAQRGNCGGAIVSIACEPYDEDLDPNECVGNGLVKITVANSSVIIQSANVGDDCDIPALGCISE
jgi:hypothetical protein